MITTEELRFAHVVVRKGWLSRPEMEKALWGLRRERATDPYCSLYSLLVRREMLSPERIEEGLRAVRSAAGEPLPAMRAQAPPPAQRPLPILGEEAPDEDGEEDHVAGFLRRAVDRLRAMPFWGTSALLHVCLLALFMHMVWSQERPEAEETAVSIIVPLLPPKERPVYTKPLPIDLHEKPYVPGRPSETEQPFFKIKEDIEPPSPDPYGTDLRNLTDMQIAPIDGYSDGVNTAIGLGGGASAMLGRRGGDGPPGGDNGSVAARSAVNAALDWLVRHQSPEGNWSCRDYAHMCDKATGPCKNHPSNIDPAGGAGGGWKEHDIGVTALAVLAFTGAGHSHVRSAEPAYREAVRKAYGYLKRVQIRGTGDPSLDGAFRARESVPADRSADARVDEDVQWMYDHAIATMAMSDLLLLSMDTIGLRHCVEDASRFCLRAQNEGWGWRYGVKMGDNDTSVTGWMVLALKLVRACRELDLIGAPGADELAHSFKGALNWIDHVTSAASGVTGYKSPGDAGSQLPELDRVAGGYPFSKEQSCMTAVGVLCRLFAGQARASDIIRKGVINSLAKHPPKWRQRAGKVPSTINFYYWYYASQAMFQYEGGLWRDWNTQMVETLLGAQRSAAKPGESWCTDGSWDPIDEWSLAGGRVYTTALGALSLEVYYRYKRVAEAAKL